LSQSTEVRGESNAIVPQEQGERFMPDGNFTMYAGKSVALAEVFKYTTGKEPIIGPVICGLELSAPSEESTDGGRLAVQHVSIVPEGGGPAVVVGTAYQRDLKFEMRTFANVADAYRKRFRTSDFPVTEKQFDEIVRRLKAFFDQFRFAFSTVDSAPVAAVRPSAVAPTAPVAAPPARASGGSAVRPAARTTTGGSARVSKRTASAAASSLDPAAENGPATARSSRTGLVIIVAVVVVGIAVAVAYVLVG
jgi:hypothetical protein